MTDHLPDAHLDAALTTLREQMLGVETPRAVEDTLLAAFKHQHQEKPRWTIRFALPRRGAGIGLAGLAAAVLAVMLVLSTPSHHPLPAQQMASADDGAEFIALDTAERIAEEPSPRLVETDIARTALAALGVPLSPENAGDLIRAQFLVSADGRPLALRLLTGNANHSPDRG